MTREEFIQIMSEFERRIMDVISHSYAVETIQPVFADKEWLSVDEAVAFLGSIGYKTTRQYVYQLRHRNAIPYAKCNGKLSFNRECLREWAIKQRTFDSEESKRNAAIYAAKSAERQLRRRIKIA